MNRKSVTRCTAYNKLDFELLPLKELNILYFQYNFPYEYFELDIVDSIYHEHAKNIINLVSNSIGKPLILTDITQLSNPKVIEAFLLKLMDIYKQPITGYRIVGNNILDDHLYRIDVFIRHKDSKWTEVFTGLHGDNVFNSNEMIFNISNIKIKPKV
jgi:hypothetical protein